MKFKAMPEKATRNMIEGAYSIISTMPRGTPQRDKAIAAAIYEQMAALAPSPSVGGLTRRQQRYLDYLIEYIDAHNGMSPTYKEIGAYFGVNKGDAFRVIRALEKRQFVEISDLSLRGIRVIRRPGLT